MVLVTVLLNNLRAFIESIIDSRKTTTITSSSTDNEYPTARAVYTQINILDNQINGVEEDMLE